MSPSQFGAHRRMHTNSFTTKNNSHRHNRSTINHSHTEVSAAARNEVEYQIDEFRSFNLDKTKVCAYCGEPIKSNDPIEVDHIKCFEEIIVGFFLLENKLQDKDIRLEVFLHLPDYTHRQRFADRQLAWKWCKYHKEHATLRILHKECNRKRG